MRVVSIKKKLMLTGPPVDHNQPDKRFYLVVFASLELKRGCVCLSQWRIQTKYAYSSSAGSAAIYNQAAADLLFRSCLR